MIALQTNIVPVLYILCLAGTVALAYAVYANRYGTNDTQLNFNLADPVCFNPEFHHQFLIQQIALLPRVPATNQAGVSVQLTRLQLADRMLNVVIPAGAVRFETQHAEEEISVASAHNVTLSRVGQVPYVYGDDVSVAGAAAIHARLIVARGNLDVRASRIKADALLANGDVDIMCPDTRVTRVSGFSYRFSPQPLPQLAQQAFKYRRYNPDSRRGAVHLVTERVADNAIITDNIVCGGSLVIGANVTIHGAVKVYESVKLTGPVLFLGPVIINGDLDAPEGCIFMSDVVVKGALNASRFMVAGQPQRHAVCVVARRLKLKGLVAGSGTLVASEAEGLHYAA